jgi:hypothetical protein
MLKLTRRLFSFRPDAFYADFHERTLFNHILASIDPEDGRTSYMVPVGRGVQQEYQNMLQSFTCCVGTGMESHALHGDGLYYESADTLWVNLFVPSTAHFESGVDLTMETDFPDGDSATISLAMRSPKALTLAVRRPSWAGDAFALRVNGEPAVVMPALASLRAGPAGGRDMGTDDRVLQPSSYVEIKRTWKSGDKITLTIPKSLRLEPTADNRTVAAIMWGPLVMAGDLGPRREGRAEGASLGAAIPTFLTAGKPVAEWLQPATRPGDFRATQVAKVVGDSGAPVDVALAPFYRTHRRTYSAYFDIVTPAEFDSRVAAFAAEKERVRKMEAATLGFVQPGDLQREREVNYQSDPADRQVQRSRGRTSRGGPGWFSFDLPVEASTDSAVVVTYLNELGLPATTGNFEILIDGTSIGRFTPNPDATGFYTAQYAIPANALRGKTKVTIRFQASGTGRIPPIYGVRTVKAREL